MFVYVIKFKVLYCFLKKSWQYTSHFKAQFNNYLSLEWVISINIIVSRSFDGSVFLIYSFRTQCKNDAKSVKFCFIIKNRKHCTRFLFIAT